MPNLISSLGLYAVGLKDAELRLAQAFLENPALRDMHAVIERHAGIHPIRQPHIPMEGLPDQAAAQTAEANPDNLASQVQEPEQNQPMAPEEGQGALSQAAHCAGKSAAGRVEASQPGGAGERAAEGSGLFTPGRGKAGYRKGAPRRRPVNAHSTMLHPLPKEVSDGERYFFGIEQRVALKWTSISMGAHAPCNDLFRCKPAARPPCQLPSIPELACW